MTNKLTEDALKKLVEPFDLNDDDYVPYTGKRTDTLVSMVSSKPNHTLIYISPDPNINIVRTNVNFAGHPLFQVITKKSSKKNYYIIGFITFGIGFLLGKSMK